MNTKRGGSVVEGGKLSSVSPSQLKTYELCARKWFYEKVLKYQKKPMGKGAQYGTECHAQIERAMLTGDVSNLNPPVLAGMKYIEAWLQRAPFSGGDALVEAEIQSKDIRISGVPVIGYIDLVLPPKHDSCAEVIDHKFRASVAKYSATSEELRFDAQAVIYSEWARRMYERDVVIFSHYNYQTQRPYFVDVVTVDMLASDIDAGLEKYERIVEAMKKDALLSRPEQIRCNTEACTAFGGCDFAKQCPDGPNNRLFGTFNKQRENESEKKMGFLTDIKNKKAEDSQKKKSSFLPPESAAILNTVTAAPAAATSDDSDKQKNEPPASIIEQDSLNIMLLLDVATSGDVSSSKSFNELVGNCARELAAQHELSDIRLAPNSSPLAYGGWKVTLARAVVNSLKQCPNGQTVLIGNSGDLVTPVVDYLLSQDTVSVSVVRGGVR